MPISITKLNTDDLIIEEITYTKETKSFISNEVLDGIQIEFAYPLEKDEIYKIDNSRFIIHLFYKDTFAANDIFEIRLSKQRLGWFFPIQALQTDQHDHANNEHFLPYAENAYIHLLLNPENLPYFELDFDTDEISLEKLYGENTYILILYKDYISKSELKEEFQFDINDFLIFFYKHGYTFLDNDNFFKLYESEAILNFDNFPESSVNINAISKDLLTDKTYINSLFQGLLKTEKHPLIKFHLLYSLIELYISKIFEFEFKENLALFQSSNDFYDAKEKLTKLTNEKARLNKLFESQCPGINADLLNNLKISSNNFLNTIDPSKTYNKSVAESIYKVRSSIFHNLRNMPTTYMSSLEDVITHFELIIIQINLKMKLK